MKLIDCLNAKGIKWGYITTHGKSRKWLNKLNSICANHKDFDDNQYYMDSQTISEEDYNNTIEQYKNLENDKDMDTTYILIRLDKFGILDIDNEFEFQLLSNHFPGLSDALKQTPQYKSRTKRNSHYMFKYEKDITIQHKATVQYNPGLLQ